jgi:hypothetical protein
MAMHLFFEICQPHILEMLNCNKNLQCNVDAYFVAFRSVLGFCVLAGEARKECIVGTVRDAHTTPRHELDDRAIPFSVLVVTHTTTNLMMVGISSSF